MNPPQLIAIKDQLKLARSIAEETFGPNPPPEVIAAILNAMSAREIGLQLESMTSDLCRAAAVAAGN